MTRLLFALTSFVAAFLLFVVQPMIAKAVLPLLGGSPAVWNLCTAFFQATLLAGYAYAHAAIGRLGARRLAIVQAGLLLLPLVALPSFAALGTGQIPSPGPAPAAWLLGFLARTVGLPFFVVATSAPIVQGWFARTGHREADDPYFLYGASNLGSMVALLGYPLAIEPNLRLARQGTLWAVGYGVLAVLLLACGAVVRLAPAGGAAEAGAAGRPPPGRWWRWVALAAVPSSLMLGVTTYLSTDIAPFPLLWVVPLALYLLSFVLVFARRPIVPAARMVRVLPIAVMLLTAVLVAGSVWPVWVPLHLLTFFAAAMVCHGRLARDRPEARHLTAFYLALAVGGVLGGSFNALVAPLVFDRIAEYPLALVAACLALPGVRPDPREARLPLVVLVLMAGLVTNVLGWSETVAGALGVMLVTGLVALIGYTHRAHPTRFALAMGAVLLAGGLADGVDGRTLIWERSFFGTLRVTAVAEGEYHRLFHGSTLHGQQSFEPGRLREPLTYFTRSGPIGQVFEAFDARPVRGGVAIVGLGAGSMACYARPDRAWTFYEIDPAIARVARDPHYFTFLRDCRAGSLAVVLGDARLRLREAPDHSSALIVLDAFSSDAVPVHLLTREALRLYRSRLAGGGLIVFNITNRYLDLDPVAGALARDAGLVCRIRYDLDLTPEQRRRGKQQSIWAVMAASEADLGPLATGTQWRPPRAEGGPVWTDDYSNIVRHLILGPRRIGKNPAREVGGGPTRDGS